METLIELYDERPLENVLGVETFRPGRVVYICPDTLPSARRVREKLELYFAHRGLELSVRFAKTQIYDAGAIHSLLQNTVAHYPDCALDITGGTDAVLFAAGLLSAGNPIPVFTYSRRKNSFFDIRNADFAAQPCEVRFRVEDFFIMAGGSMRPGRMDNALLEGYRELIEPFFQLYLRFRRQWTRIIGYLQRVSAVDPGAVPPLEIDAAYTVKGDRGTKLDAPEQALAELELLGLLQDLRIEPGVRVKFRFADGFVRTWLRDVGSVLELYCYQTCLDLGLFDDVRLSAVVDWEGDERRNAVTNELDVVCTKGVTPIFISCKTGEVKTEALNELAVLRDRFGGKMARAAVVTAERGGAAMRNRAAELGIQVIDLNDLTAGRLERRLRSLIPGGKA